MRTIEADGKASAGYPGLWCFPSDAIPRRPMFQPGVQPIIQPVGQSISQPIGQSIGQSIDNLGRFGPVVTAGGLC